LTSTSSRTNHPQAQNITTKKWKKLKSLKQRRRRMKMKIWNLLRFLDLDLRVV
jgi:hypothetical protein